MQNIKLTKIYNIIIIKLYAFLIESLIVRFSNLNYC